MNVRFGIALICAGLGACSMNEEERDRLLESAERTNYAIGRGTVVRDLRSPSDTGRLVYERPVDLSQRSDTTAGPRQVWAPFGIATPDTVAAKVTTNR